MWGFLVVCHLEVLAQSWGYVWVERLYRSWAFGLLPVILKPGLQAVSIGVALQLIGEIMDGAAPFIFTFILDLNTELMISKLPGSSHMHKPSLGFGEVSSFYWPDQGCLAKPPGAEWRVGAKKSALSWDFPVPCVRRGWIRGNQSSCPPQVL